MTFPELIGLCGLFLAILLLLTSVLLHRCGIKHLAISFAAAHVFYIACLAILYDFGRRDAQAELFWMAPSMIDLPVSLVLLMVRPSDIGTAGVVSVLGILGSLQYAFIGAVLDLIRSRNH